jgi:DNA polymerase-1
MTNFRYLPFGEILTDMEREGILVNRNMLAEVQIQAERDADASSERFLNWAVCH